MDDTKEKICTNCGQKLPYDSSFCVKCGMKIEADLPGNDAELSNRVQKNKKKIGIGIAVVIGILLMLFAVNSIQASDLKKELKREWERVEGDDGAYILCILDFSDDKIEYRLETGYAWMNTTVATYDYKVVSGNKIKVMRYNNEWQTVTVEFNEDKSMMTVKPALTSIDNEENWFNLDW